MADKLFILSTKLLRDLCTGFDSEEELREVVQGLLSSNHIQIITPGVWDVRVDHTLDKVVDIGAIRTKRWLSEVQEATGLEPLELGGSNPNHLVVKTSKLND